MSKKYKVTSQSKDNHKHEWTCDAQSPEHAGEITKHLLDVVKGWSTWKYKPILIEEVKP